MYPYKREGYFFLMHREANVKTEQREIWRWLSWKMGILIIYESFMIIIYFSLLSSVHFCFIILEIVIWDYSHKILIYSYWIIVIIIRICLISTSNSISYLHIFFWHQNVHIFTHISYMILVLLPQLLVCVYIVYNFHPSSFKHYMFLCSIFVSFMKHDIFKSILRSLIFYL